LLLRSEQPPGDEEPVVHYGLIASANRLMRGALKKGILCFEMELPELSTTCPACSSADFAAMQTRISLRMAGVCCVDRGSICEESLASYSSGHGRRRNDSPPKSLERYH
ncbi:hypothetical protein BJX65DRAFT_281191, partial [Aspergillus insuetus]